jgi:hypothetical protein
MNYNPEETLFPLILDGNGDKRSCPKPTVVKAYFSCASFCKEEGPIPAGKECDRRRKLRQRGAGECVHAKMLPLRGQ